MNAWHQGRSQGRKGKFTDLFFSLSFFLSCFRAVFLYFSVVPLSLSFALFAHSCVFMSLVYVVCIFVSCCISVSFSRSLSVCLLPPTPLSHLYVSFILRGNICPSVLPKDCHRELKPLVLSMTEDISAKPPLSVTVFHILSARVLSFSGNRHIRVY